ncbi:MAG: T9SS type A sorting domain-containing protein [Chitinispirillaceae bacterium]|nr:T9SS type A sorting domain-containing protein [Chitinispirillaceae bacterium]
MKKVLTMIVCAWVAALAFGQWEMVTGPVEFTSPGDAVALNATTFLKIAGNTVSKTTDFGESWTDIVLPEGVSLTAIDAASETVVYACANGGLVYKSVNGGDDWTQVGDTANFKIDMKVIDVLDSANVFIGGGTTTPKAGWFFKTADAGASWDTTLVGAELNDGGVAFTSATNGIIFDDGTTGIIHTTHNGGDTWTDYAITLPIGLASKRMYCASAAVGTSTFLIGAYNNVIWKSTDGGDNWAVCSEITYAYDRIVDIKAFDANTYIAASSVSDLLVTADGGTSWDTLAIGSAQSCQAIAYSSPTNGMVFSSYGQDYTTADGETFVPMHEWPGVSFFGLAFPSENKIAVSATFGGEFTMSEDNGATFSYPTNAGTKAKSSLFKTVFIDENTGLVGGSSGFIAKTVDGGDTWTTIPTPMAEQSNKHINMLYIAPNGDIFAGGSSGLVMRSTDDGDTWNLVSIGSTQTVYDMCVFSNGMAMLGQGSGQYSVSTSTSLDTFALVMDNGGMSYRSIVENGEGVILVGASDAIWRTTVDAYDTLEKVFDVPGALDIYGVAFVNDTLAYAVGEKGVVLYSEDAGLTWEAELAGPEVTETTIQNLQFNGKKLWAVGQDGLIMFKDYTPRYTVRAHVNMSVQMRLGNFVHAGHHLDIVGSFNGWGAGISMTDADGDSIYSAELGEFEEGVTLSFKCRRNGSWDNTEEFPFGGSNREYVVIAEDDQDIPVFFYSDVTEVAVNGVPDTYAMAQNYPNPFNPSTTVSFQIPASELVSLSVYNLTGRKIADLVHAQLEAGYYHVDFDGSMLPSGIYIYRLTAGEFSSVKKMTLLK